VSFTIATPGGSAIITEAGAITASKTNIVRMEYAGVNADGNNEVSISITSL